VGKGSEKKRSSGRQTAGQKSGFAGPGLTQTPYVQKSQTAIAKIRKEKNTPEPKHCVVLKTNKPFSERAGGVCILRWGHV